MASTEPVSTLHELARVAGVTAAMVSRALADNPTIAKSTRARIQALAQEHGFQINKAARNLRLGLTGAIGMVLPLGHEAEQHLSDPFFMSLLARRADEIAKRGYDLLLSRMIPKDNRWLHVTAVLVASDDASGRDMRLGCPVPAIASGWKIRRFGWMPDCKH